MPYPAANDPRVRHIVVVMLENRSFDHLLGWWKGGPDGLSGNEVNHAPAVFGDNVGVHRAVNPCYGDDPSHEHHDVMQQLLHDRVTGEARLPVNGRYDPTNDGFAINFAELTEGENAGADVMRGLDRSAVPILTSLAENYSHCTRWFCSVPGQTWPNRCFAHASTSEGDVDIRKSRILTGYRAKTIFEELEAGGFDWRVYMCGRIAQVQTYKALRTRDRRKKFIRFYDQVEGFLAAVDEDRLPEYSFIEPDHFPNRWLGGSSNSQHPGNNSGDNEDFVGGEKLIRDIYSALSRNPVVWEKTLLIITYDEHGGIFDHVLPPSGAQYRTGDVYSYTGRSVPPGYPPNGRFEFDLLGPRVPTVVVSPYSDPNHPITPVLDHCTIPATIRHAFLGGGPPGTGANTRAINAKSLLDGDLGLLSLGEARQPETLPEPPERVESLTVAAVDDEDVSLDEFQQALFDLAAGIYQEGRQMKGVDLMGAPIQTDRQRLRWLEEVYGPWWDEYSGRPLPPLANS